MENQDWTPGAVPMNDFDEAIDYTLQLTAHLARDLIGAHQGAAAMIMNGDWKSVRKYFSLSPKYSQWYTYRTPAVGFGIHALVVKENKPIRLTQTELEAHPEWKGFGKEASAHPPMRGWMAAPVIGWDDRNYGLLQVSDKYNDEEFSAEDEVKFVRLARLTATTLDAICALFNNHSLGHPPQL